MWANITSCSLYSNYSALTHQKKLGLHDDPEEPRLKASTADERELNGRRKQTRRGQVWLKNRLRKLERIEERKHVKLR